MVIIIIGRASDKSILLRVEWNLARLRFASPRFILTFAETSGICGQDPIGFLVREFDIVCSPQQYEARLASRNPLPPESTRDRANRAVAIGLKHELIEESRGLG
jgi:hypothetical protein